jgi:hypothetical protein
LIYPGLYEKTPVRKKGLKWELQNKYENQSACLPERGPVGWRFPKYQTINDKTTCTEERFHCRTLPGLSKRKNRKHSGSSLMKLLTVELKAIGSRNKLINMRYYLSKKFSKMKKMMKEKAKEKKG